MLNPHRGFPWILAKIPPAILLRYANYLRGYFHGYNPTTETCHWLCCISQQDQVRTIAKFTNYCKPSQSPASLLRGRQYPCTGVVQLACGMWNDFEIEPFPSRAAAASALQSRCAASKLANREAWTRAWNNFKFDAQFILPPLRCISVFDIHATRKRKHSNIEYKSLAVKHFLPVLQSRLPLLTGRAHVRVAATISTLQH